MTDILFRIKINLMLSQ